MSRVEHKDPASYYDAYSRQYDAVRISAYHRTVNSLTRDFLLRFVRPGHRVLDLGCGTGIHMDWLREQQVSAFGLDLSFEMIRKAQDKAHLVTRGTAVRLPFRGETFDLVYSFKVLPHVEAIEDAFEEIHRVLKPGGVAVLECYSPYSIRGLIKRLLRPALSVAEGLTERQIYTRFDGPRRMRRYMQPGFSIVASRGTVIFCPIAAVYEWPILGPVFGWLERAFCDTPLKYLSGFFMTAGRRKPENE
jgi:ubiquinone/menaquinone biosynthesis C-methylase UbiE